MFYTYDFLKPTILVLLRLGVRFIFVLEVLNLDRIININLFNWSIKILVLQKGCEITLIILRGVQWNFSFTFFLRDQQVQAIFDRSNFLDQQFRRFHLFLSMVFVGQSILVVHDAVLLFEAIVVEPLPPLHLFLSISIVKVLVDLSIVDYILRALLTWLVALNKIDIGRLLILFTRSGILIWNGPLVDLHL